MQIVRRTWAWWLAGLAFVLYPALRPWGDTGGSPQEELAAMASGRWVLAHLLGMAAFALLPVALDGLRAAGLLVGVTALRRAQALAYAGVVAVLPYYGGEAFGLHAVGAYATDAAAGAAQPGLAAVVDGFRYQPAAITLFGVGLVLLAVAGVLALVAARRSGTAWVLAAAALGLGLVLYLPQFFAAPPLRVAHGLLLAAGCWSLALLQGSRTSLPRT